MKLPIFALLLCVFLISPNALAGLTGNEIQALNAAIDDEYRARATYQNTIERFGDVRPFSKIAGAEERHVGALKSLFQLFGLKVPPDEWKHKAPVALTLKDACAAGIKSEERNIQLYETLLTNVQDKNIRDIFSNLKSASKQHLRAFKRCA